MDANDFQSPRKWKYALGKRTVWDEENHWRPGFPHRSLWGATAAVMCRFVRTRFKQNLHPLIPRLWTGEGRVLWLPGGPSICNHIINAYTIHGHLSTLKCQPALPKSPSYGDIRQRKGKWNMLALLCSIAYCHSLVLINHPSEFSEYAKLLG